MFKKILNFNYNIQQIKLSLDNAFFSAMSASLVVPIFLYYISQDILDSRLLRVWLLSQFIVLMFRIMIIHRLFSYISSNLEKVESYFKVFIGLIFLTAVLNIYIIVLTLANTIDPLKIALLSIVVITLSAGSISTLLGVFNVYLIFVVLTMFTFIDALLYFGGEEFYLFSFILGIFTLFSLKIGYKQYLLVNNISALKNTFQTIYDTSSDAMILLKDLRFLDCNKTAVRLFKFDSKKELLSTHIKNFLPKYQPDGELSMKKMLKMFHIAHEKGYHSFEWQYKKQNGELFYVDYALTKVNIDGKELLHGVFRDITKRKEMEEDRERFQHVLEKRVEEEVEKNRKKDKAMMYQSRLAQMGEMINMIAHQWRQPLAAITAATSALTLKASRDRLDAKTALELSNKITEFSLHLSETIDDFRSFFQSNKVKVETDYYKITKSVLSIIESSLEKHNIELKIKVIKLYVFDAYENELKQVLLNLVKNAEDVLIENNVKRAKIVIEIDKYDLIVSDNGGGIDEDIMEKIFEPYFSTKLKKDGTGLGLYMSKMIVEDHCEGKITVHNTKDGVSFKINLGENNA